MTKLILTHSDTCKLILTHSDTCKLILTHSDTCSHDTNKKVTDYPVAVIDSKGWKYAKHDVFVTVLNRTPYVWTPPPLKHACTVIVSFSANRTHRHAYFMEMNMLAKDACAVCSHSVNVDTTSLLPIGDNVPRSNQCSNVPTNVPMCQPMCQVPSAKFQVPSATHVPMCQPMCQVSSAKFQVPSARCNQCTKCQVPSATNVPSVPTMF